jgi:hypothetical protein
MEQPEGLGAGGDGELIPQGLDTNAVLAAYHLLFVFCGITPHQQPVHGLTARITPQGQLGELLRGGRSPGIEMNFSKASRACR